MTAHTDRELLELAAKAVSYDINFDEPVNDWYPHGYDDNGDVVAWWNPLKDDGNALRMAVQLRLDVSHMAMEVFASKGPQLCFIEPNDDPYAATRRVIVRAAAAIGEAMP